MFALWHTQWSVLQCCLAQWLWSRGCSLYAIVRFATNDHVFTSLETCCCRGGGLLLTRCYVYIVVASFPAQMDVDSKTFLEPRLFELDVRHRGEAQRNGGRPWVASLSQLPSLSAELLTPRSSRRRSSEGSAVRKKEDDETPDSTDRPLSPALAGQRSCGRHCNEAPASIEVGEPKGRQGTTDTRVAKRADLRKGDTSGDKASGAEAKEKRRT